VHGLQATGGPQSTQNENSTTRCAETILTMLDAWHSNMGVCLNHHNKPSSRQRAHACEPM
jgi:hypothetical protein